MYVTFFIYISCMFRPVQVESEFEKIKFVLRLPHKSNQSKFLIARIQFEQERAESSFHQPKFWVELVS